MNDETETDVEQPHHKQYQACSSRVLQLSTSAETLPMVDSEKEQEAASENIGDYRMFRTVMQSPYCKRGLTLELHFLVTGYGGLRLPFHDITQYLCGLVTVYERPIIAGVHLLMVYSTGTRLFAAILFASKKTVACSR